MSNPKTQRMRTRVGKYELGKSLGEGTFAKVKFTNNIETGQCVAIKILDREQVLKHKMVEHIKREISTMKLIKHPNVTQIDAVQVKALWQKQHEHRRRGSSWKPCSRSNPE